MAFPDHWSPWHDTFMRIFEWESTSHNLLWWATTICAKWMVFGAPVVSRLGDPLEDLTASAPTSANPTHTSADPIHTSADPSPTSANTTDPAHIEGLWDKLRSEIDSERGYLRTALEAAVRREALAKEGEMLAREGEVSARNAEIAAKELSRKREEEAELELGRERSEREKESGRWLDKEALWVAEKGRLNERIRELEEQIAA
ncbi:MAG: hypothetical protein M1839_006333 [Geoglossum umbratile]|nr:MAG: hypothetical protein M1839_006333 [Geoglossum umbratile]